MVRGQARAGLVPPNVTLDDRKPYGKRERVIAKKDLVINRQSVSLRKAHQCISRIGCSEVKVPIW